MLVEEIYQRSHVDFVATGVDVKHWAGLAAVVVVDAAGFLDRFCGEFDAEIVRAFLDPVLALQFSRRGQRIDIGVIH